MKYLLTILLLTSCGFDVDVKDSKHDVNHNLILDGNLAMFDEMCTNEFPDDVEAQQDCVNGYMELLSIILKNSTIGEDDES